MLEVPRCLVGSAALSLDEEDAGDVLKNDPAVNGMMIAVALLRGSIKTLE